MTLGSHQQTIGKSQTWITPLWILDALGPFDLDPCAADPRPWDCATTNWTVGGLNQWPPGKRVWIARLAEHGRGTALLHARTEAEWFEPCWRSASGILFLSDRIYFHYPDGRRAEANSGAPACLVAFGSRDLAALATSGIDGYLVTQWSKQR